jgi:hypothetical protein
VEIENGRLMKRIAAKLMFLIVLGAIINLAAAWACAHFGEEGEIQAMHLNRMLNEYEEERIITINAFGYKRLSRRFAPTMVAAGELAWSDGKTPDLLYLYNPRIPRFEVESGWPLYALSAEAYVNVETLRRWRWQAEVTTPYSAVHWAIQLKGSSNFLPANPIWPGFAINTIFYAAVLWVVFAVPVKVRRWRRMKRGQCASCGYSLRESMSEKCPDCGAPSPQRGVRV